MAPKRINFAAEMEGKSVYQLENGCKLTCRTILVCVADEGKFHPDGTPIYQMQFNQMVDLDTTEMVREPVPPPSPTNVELKITNPDYWKVKK